MEYTNEKREKYSSDLLEKLMSEITPFEQERTNQKMLLAAKIDEAIKEAKFSKGKLAKLLGKKPSEISWWLSGTYNFTYNTLYDIQEALGIKILSTDLGHNA